MAEEESLPKFSTMAQVLLALFMMQIGVCSAASNRPWAAPVEESGEKIEVYNFVRVSLHYLADPPSYRLISGPKP